MPGLRWAGAFLLLAAALTALYASEPLGALSPMEVAGTLALGGLSLILSAAIVDGFARHWTYGVQAMAVSGGIVAALGVVYAARSEWQNVLDRVIGDLSFGRIVATAGGDAVAARRSDGSFVLAGRVNGNEARFIFDTGASTVVLRAENAGALGVRPEALDYSIPVATANGGALAAPVTLDSLAIGPIVERNVRALVAREGTLHANLLGMTFLERLASYEVRGNRLILRGRDDANQAK